MARGLALQALGHLCTLVRHQDDVQFRVLERLSSDNVFETQSALFCIGRLVALSEPFAEAVLRSAPPLLEDAALGDQFKLGLLRVLGGMGGHREAVASKVRALSISFMQSHPREDFVVGSLATLSRVSDLHAEEHVSLLWEHLLADPRPRVRLACLRGLFALAHRAPHHGDHRPALLLALLPQQSPAIQAAMLAVLAMLARFWHAAVSLVALDTAPLDPLLVSPDARVRLWALRALAGAAAFSAASARQLFGFVSTVMVTEAQSARSPLLSACLSLCSREVARHSPDLGAKVVAVLLRSAKQPHREDAWALVHVLSLAVRRDAGPPALEGELEDLVRHFSGDPACFTAAMVALVRVARAVNERGHVVQDGRYSALLQPQQGLATTDGDWTWAWYRVAREAASAGLHKVASGMFGLVAQFPVSDRFRCWLVFLTEATRAESHLQVSDLTEAVVSWRRAVTAVAAAGPPAMQQSAATAAVQTIARSSAMTFQKRYAKWRLGVAEASASRSDLWLALAHEAVTLSQSFPDLPVATVTTLKECADCCAAIGGRAVGRAERDSSLVSQLHAALAGPNHAGRADMLNAFHVASASSFPRYFFKTDPTTSVELAIAKPKASNDMMEISLFNASDTGHIVTIDGVIRQSGARRPPRVFSGVELEVSVVWSAEKPSVAARLLCCERAVGTVLSRQCCKSRVTGGSFSTLTVLTFPNHPKQQHLISIRVSLIEAETQVRFDNVALVTLAISMLTS